jgi:hypothetical protein
MKVPPKGSQIRTLTNGKWQLKAKQPCTVTQVRPQIPPRDASYEAAREAARRIADKYCTRDGPPLVSVTSSRLCRLQPT